MREVERLLSAPPLVSSGSGGGGGGSGGGGGGSVPSSPTQLVRIPSSRSRYAVNPMSVIGERVVIAMVGLPARGKSYTSRAIEHYFTFLGCPVKLFNAGSRRRDQGLAGAASSFFDPSNSDAKQQRDQLAMETLDDLLAWLEAPHACDETWSGCACGIFDATNTTVARRRAVIERCARAERLSAMPLRLVFVESICNDEEILRHSYRLKLSNGDYAQQDPERALVDFLARVREYEKVYETIGEDEAKGYEGEFDTNGGRLRFVQTVDAGRRPRCSRDVAEMQPRWSRDGAEMSPRWSRDGAAMEPRWSRESAKIPPSPGGGRRSCRSVSHRLTAAGCGVVRRLVASGCNTFLMSHLVSLLHAVHVFPRTSRNLL